MDINLLMNNSKFKCSFMNTCAWNATIVCIGVTWSINFAVSSEDLSQHDNHSNVLSTFTLV